MVRKAVLSARPIKNSQRPLNPKIDYMRINTVKCYSVIKKKANKYITSAQIKLSNYFNLLSTVFRFTKVHIYYSNVCKPRSTWRLIPRWFTQNTKSFQTKHLIDTKISNPPWLTVPTDHLVIDCQWSVSDEIDWVHRQPITKSGIYIYSRSRWPIPTVIINKVSHLRT